MAISRVASGNGAAGSAALSGSFAAGDLIILCIQNTGSSTTPGQPTGYTTISSATDATNNHTMRMVYKYAASGSESMPVLNIATSVSWAIYRGIHATAPVTQIAGQAGVSSSMSSSGIVTYANPGADWVIIGATGKPITGNIGSHPPTSMTLVTEYKTGSDDNAFFDSNTPLSSYSFNTKTLDASVSWHTKTFELIAAGGSPQSLIVPLVSAASAVYVPYLTPIIAPPLVGPSSQIFAPTLALGPIGLAVPLITSVSQIYLPHVGRGPVALDFPLLSSSSQIFAPVVAFFTLLSPPLVSSASQVFAPVVSPGPRTLLPPYLDPISQVFAPLLSQGPIMISPPLVGPSSQVYPPTIRRAIDPNELVLLGVG